MACRNMLTPMLALPRQVHEQIPELLVRAGAALRPDEGAGDAFPDISWQRFICWRGTSAAMLGIGLEARRHDRCIVTMSPHLRRVLLPWRWLGDWRLIRDLANALAEAGASSLDDIDT
jgi:hypothetical protein